MKKPKDCCGICHGLEFALKSALPTGLWWGTIFLFGFLLRNMMVKDIQVVATAYIGGAECSQKTVVLHPEDSSASSVMWPGDEVFQVSGDMHPPAISKIKIEVSR